MCWLTCIPTDIHAHAHVSSYTYLYVHTHTCTCTYIIYTRIHTYTYMYIHVCIYVYTNIPRLGLADDGDVGLVCRVDDVDDITGTEEESFSNTRRKQLMKAQYYHCWLIRNDYT